MTQNDSYAQVRIGFYEARFQSETTNQLVNDFNSLAASRGWTAERAYFSHALIKEMQRRDIDLSAICKRESNGDISSISYQAVRYDEENLTLIPVSQEPR